MKLIYEVERYPPNVFGLIGNLRERMREEVSLSYDSTAVERLVRVQMDWRMQNVSTNFVICGIRAYVSIMAYMVSVMQNDHPPAEQLSFDMRAADEAHLEFHGMRVLLVTQIPTDMIAIGGGRDMLSVHLSGKMTYSR
jgi:hypothetical protein